jgi:hypothetical protein
MRFIISFSLSVKQKIANFEPLKVHEDHIFELWHRQPVNCIRRDQNSTYFKSPYRPDAIWQGDANFQFSMTFNFNILLCFSNIRNHLSNFSYLVCISCKIFIGWRFYLFLKTENSRRVAESRPVCQYGPYKGLIPRVLFLGEMRNILHEMKSCMRSKDKLGLN